MEIKVNDYIRTKNGKIGKVIDISNVTGQKRKKYLIKWKIAKVYYITDMRIQKSSKNIIDLIEVGDYVNGSKIIEIDNCKGAMRELYLEGQNPEKECGLYFEQIETILTKEQYEVNCYRLEEK